MDPEAESIQAVLVLDPRDPKAMSVGPLLLQVFVFDGRSDLVNKPKLFEQLDGFLKHRLLYFRNEVDPFAKASDNFDI